MRPNKHILRHAHHAYVEEDHQYHRKNKKKVPVRSASKYHYKFGVDDSTASTAELSFSNPNEDQQYHQKKKNKRKVTVRPPPKYQYRFLADDSTATELSFSPPRRSLASSLDDSCSSKNAADDDDATATTEVSSSPSSPARSLATASSFDSTSSNGEDSSSSSSWCVSPIISAPSSIVDEDQQYQHNKNSAADDATATTELSSSQPRSLESLFDDSCSSNGEDSSSSSSPTTHIVLDCRNVTTGSAPTLHEVTEIMRNNYENLDVQLAALRTLSRVLFVQEGEEEEEEEDFFSTSTDVVATTISTTEEEDALLCSTIVNAMARHSDDPELQRLAAFVLGKFVQGEYDCDGVSDTSSNDDDNNNNNPHVPPKIDTTDETTKTQMTKSKETTKDRQIEYIRHSELFLKDVLGNEVAGILSSIGIRTTFHLTNAEFEPLSQLMLQSGLAEDLAECEDLAENWKVMLEEHLNEMRKSPAHDSNNRIITINNNNNNTSDISLSSQQRCINHFERRKSALARARGYSALAATASRPWDDPRVRPAAMHALTLLS